MQKMNENPLFDENIKLVHFAIKKYFNNGIGFENSGFSREDMFQIGCIGLFNSANRFDEKLGYKFSTFAISYIIGEIKRELTDKAAIIKYPRRVKNAARLISRLENKDIITTEEVMEKFDLTDKQAELAIECMNSFSTVSLDSTVNDENENALSNIIPSEYSLEDSVLYNMNVKEELDKRLSILTEKERKVVLVSLQSKNQTEVGLKLNISQVQVSRLMKKALSKIEKHFESAEGVLY